MTFFGTAAMTPSFHRAFYAHHRTCHSPVTISSVRALIGHERESEYSSTDLLLTSAYVRVTQFSCPMRELGSADVSLAPLTRFGNRGCIIVKRRRAFEGKKVQNSPLYFQMFVPKSWLLTFYPLSFGQLNDMRLVKSQFKIIHPSPKFVSWPL